MHFKSYYDVSLLQNFSFNQSLFSSEDFYNIHLLSTSNTATIEDFDTYVTIDAEGNYAYHEIVLFSIQLSINDIRSHTPLVLVFRRK